MAKSYSFQCDTSVTSSVASSTSVVTLLAANSARLGAAIYNNSTAVLSIILDVTAGSPVVYLPVAASGGYVEIPFNYAGAIKGQWASANGAAYVTEFR